MPNNGLIVSGNVGIGTLTPGAALEVTRQTGATNDYTAIFVNGNVGVGTRTPEGALNVYGSRFTVQGEWYTDERQFVPIPNSWFSESVSQWVPRTASSSSVWQSIAWSPQLGIFAAVAFSGTSQIMTSPDGINWTNQSTSFTNNWTSIAWSPELGIFAAVGLGGSLGNQVMTSSNGINWFNQSASSTNLWSGIAWSPELGIFAAITYSIGKTMTSSNGINWSDQTAPAGLWNSITWSSELGIFAAVSSTGTNQVMTSSNGINWISRTPASSNAWFGISWSPELGIFAAVATSGSTGNKVMTSTNGINWENQLAASSNAWKSIAWSPEFGVFSAISDSGSAGNQVMTSSNGINWTNRTASYSNSWQAIAWSPELGIFTAVAIEGSAGSKVMTSWNSFGNPYGVGQIVQVVSGTKTDPFSTTATFTSGGAFITGLSAIITPTSSTNKMFIKVSLSVSTPTGDNEAVAGWIVRNGVQIGQGASSGSRVGINAMNNCSDNDISTVIAMSYQDSPGTTSQLTYRVKVSPGVAASTAYVNRSNDDQDAATMVGARSSSTITVMEVVS